MSLLDKEEYINHNLKMMINFEEEVKWLKHYASFHEILLVGDGDFSFSLCLAKAFGSASNIVATSLDTYDVVINKYQNAKLNLQMLRMLGAIVLHGVDATKMGHHTDLQMRRFDRIIFNFPHAGFHGKEDHLPVIKKHRELLYGFFRNASRMLRPYGEVHVNHKTTHPFCSWKLEELALKSSLVRIDCVDFKISDYPGYNHKRGDGSRCDKPFPLGEASTYKFIFPTATRRISETNPPTSICRNIQHEPTAIRRISETNPPTSICRNIQHEPTAIRRMGETNPPTSICRNIQHEPTATRRISETNPPTSICRNIQHEPTAIRRMGETNPPTSICRNIQHEPTYLNPQFASRPSDVASGNYILPRQPRIINDCYRTFDWYVDYAATTFGRTDYDVAHYYDQEGLRHGRFIAERAGRHSTYHIFT